MKLSKETYHTGSPNVWCKICLLWTVLQVISQTCPVIFPATSKVVFSILFLLKVNHLFAMGCPTKTSNVSFFNLSALLPHVCTQF